MVREFPFVEIGSIRIFPETATQKDLQWHWDEQDRLITPLHETNWQFQFDNELPQALHEGVSLFIKAGAWHRLIIGTGELTLSVIKHDRL